ncbi:Uncharacterised protein [Escherichia coli]|uniref:Uncharacterized protein n=1 Tax=Escherichia coli TaxID=562 RepID=A0A377D9S3_ECOLX|nr:Uncharacterised protein [Escherichia coli]
MVSLEKNDHLMLGAPAAIEICCPDTGGRTCTRLKGFNE